MEPKNWIKTHALPIYFVLAYAVSWSAVLLVAGVGRFQGQAIPPEKIAVMVAAMLLGPCGGGLLLTWLADGRQGLAGLAARLSPRRAAGRWYAALLINPLVTLGALLGLAALVSPAYLPGFNPIGLLVGLVAGAFEEIGWTGFATPRLLKKHSPLAAGLILGVLWGGWHLLAGFTGSPPGQVGLWLADAAVFWVGGLAAYRVLMTLVYARARSVLLGQVMHLVFTGSFATLVRPMPFAEYAVFDFAMAAGLWLATAAVVARFRRSLAAQPASSIA